MFAKEGIEMSGYVPQSNLKSGSFDLDGEKRKILDSVKKDSTLQLVLKEIKELKEAMSNGDSDSSEEEHPSIDKIKDILRGNDFTEEYIIKTVNALKRNLTVEEMEDFDVLQEHLAEAVAEDILISDDVVKGKPSIYILVGPTGVGKTTTIAKLAALFGIGNGDKKPLSVRMLTADNYRIGARKQIETYGDIMGIPVAGIESSEDVKKKVALFQEADLILVDTIGKSPKDFVKLAEMRELFESCIGTAVVHLAISATTKTSDMLEILQQFESFNFSSIVLTKLDETTRVGNIISVLSAKNKPISYITDGQGVPQDIEKATAFRLLKHISGLKFNRQKFEQKYG
jgi:flagellar biosynthesis protein FlhF